MSLKEKLKEHRLNAGYTHAYHIYTKWGILRQGLSNIEKGISIPLKSEILALSYIYKLSEKEVRHLFELRELELKK